MATRKAPKRRSRCPLHAALEVFGDRWTLLIVRDLMFKNRHTYNEFLKAEERIATNILADRLQRLEALGIITRTPNPADGRGAIYHLTNKGVDLAPVLMEMILWSACYEETDAPPVTIREMKDHRESFIAKIRRQWADAR